MQKNKLRHLLPHILSLPAPTPSSLITLSQERYGQTLHGEGQSRSKERAKYKGKKIKELGKEKLFKEPDFKGCCRDVPWESLISYLSFPRPRDLGRPSLPHQFALLFGLLGPRQWDR